MKYHLNYNNQIEDRLGKTLKHPTTGERLFVTEQSYDPNTNTTRLTLEGVSEGLE